MLPKGLKAKVPNPRPAGPGRHLGAGGGCWSSPAACSLWRPRSPMPPPAGAGSPGDRPDDRPRGRLLRGRCLSPQRPGGGSRGHAPQHRRLVAGDRGGLRGHPGHRQRLRGPGQGLRGAAAGGSGLQGEGRRVSALARDPAELLASLDLSTLGKPGRGRRIAFHPPCTLQHGQKVVGVTEAILTRLGFALTPVPDAHLCCGSAGTYSITQPALSKELRANKVAALESGGPELIATANIGCQLHLEAGTALPVVHWLELLDG
jgi:hypothetical protein